MANLSISDIAKQWKVSRPTILKRLKSGELSGVKDAKGKWEVDSSEVARVLGEPVNVSDNIAIPVASPLQDELTAALKDQISTLKDQLEETNTLNRDLVNQLAAQTRLLEHHRPQGFFARLFSSTA